MTASSYPVPKRRSTAKGPAHELKMSRDGYTGIKPVPALQAICAGLALRFLVPIPSGVTEQGWSLLSIFVTTILGLVLDPLPVGAWAFIACTSCK
jgi:DASS family divalent anion:Na+ symporter